MADEVEDFPPPVTRGRGRSFYGSDVEEEKEEDLPPVITRGRGRSFYNADDTASPPALLARSRGGDDREDDMPPLPVSRARGRSFYGNDPPMPVGMTGGSNDDGDCGDASDSGSSDSGLSIAMRMAQATQQTWQADKKANAAATALQKVARGNSTRGPQQQWRIFNSLDQREECDMLHLAMFLDSLRKYLPTNNDTDGSNSNSADKVPSLNSSHSATRPKSMRSRKLSMMDMGQIDISR